MGTSLLLYFFTAGFTLVFTKNEGMGMKAKEGYQLCRLNDCTVLGHTSEVPSSKGGFLDFYHWYLHPKHFCYGIDCFTFFIDDGESRRLLLGKKDDEADDFDDSDDGDDGDDGESKRRLLGKKDDDSDDFDDSDDGDDGDDGESRRLLLGKKDDDADDFDDSDDGGDGDDGESRRLLLGKKDDDADNFDDSDDGDDGDDGESRRRLLGKKDDDADNFDDSDDGDDGDDGESKRRLLQVTGCKDASNYFQSLLPCCEEYVVEDDNGEDICDVIAKFGYQDCDMFYDIMSFNNIKKRLLNKGESIQVC